MTLSGCCGLLQGGGWRGLSAGFRPSRAHSSWSKQARSCCRCLPRPYFHGTSARAWRAGAPGVATARIWRPGREAAGSHGGGGELGLVSGGGPERKGRAGGSLGSRAAAHGGFCCVFLFCMKKVYYENRFSNETHKCDRSPSLPVWLPAPGWGCEAGRECRPVARPGCLSSAFSAPKASSAPQRWP